MEHFYVELGDPSCVGFRDIVRKNRDRQTNAGENHTLARLSFVSVHQIAPPLNEVADIQPYLARLSFVSVHQMAPPLNEVADIQLHLTTHLSTLKG